jgi:hypothetical protein
MLSYLDPSDVPELTIFRVHVKNRFDDYYWRIDLKGRLKEAIPPNTRLLGVTKRAEREAHNYIVEDIRNFTMNSENKNYRELINTQRDIGSLIYSNLGLRKVFDIFYNHLADKVDTMLIATNDFEIPWDWTTNADGEILGEKFIIGYLSLEREYPLKREKMEREKIKRFGYIDFQEAKSNSVIVIVGNLNGEKDYQKSVKSEMKQVEKIFRGENNEGFTKIEKLDGKKIDKEMTRIFRHSENIQVIHYVGHITSDGHIKYSDTGCITPESLMDTQPKEHVLRYPSSLVFLNGCRAGEVKDIYVKTGQLSTAFIAMGAVLCIAPRVRIPNPVASTYVETFYKTLLKNFGMPIAKVLKETREAWKREIKEEWKLKTKRVFPQLGELLPSFYLLYGNPAFAVFPKRAFDENMEEVQKGREVLPTLRIKEDSTYIEARKILVDTLKLIRSTVPKSKCNRRKVANFGYRRGYLNGEVVNRAVITLRARGCGWGEKGMGCTMCGHYAGMLRNSVNPEDLIQQFDECMRHIKFKETPILCVYNGGNFFNTNEIPYEAQKYICEAVAKNPYIKKFVVESRIEYCEEALLRELKAILKNKSFVIAVGLETKNDKLRDLSINKGLSLSAFEKKAELINSIAELRVYAMIKPLFLTESEMIEDAVDTIRYINELGPEEIHFEPITVQEYTLVYYLWRQGVYRLPWLWSIIEILKRVAPIHVYCSPFAHFPEPIAKPHNCPTCNDTVLNKLFKDYNEYFNIKSLEELNCRCKEAWHSQLTSRDSRSLEKRVIDILNSTRQFILSSERIKTDLFTLQESHFGPPKDFEKAR